MQYELEEIPLFDGLKSADLEMIGQHIFSKTYKQNERIIVEGGINRHFCVIKKGKVKICCSGPNGKETIFSFLEAGQYFGEMSLLGRERCCATVYCLQACEIYCIRDMYFRKLLTKVPGLAWRLLNQMSGRLRSSNHCIENLNCRDSVQKVGNVIPGPCGIFRLPLQTVGHH
ncbi:MAG: Crp/Fnr family transcriptional regulator [Candidatus Marinimicrobia bacterium]|nr:Crp/Fnr family transcriptional regulator [Candidatus Neomarinimicrobiota bacterium]